MDEVRKKIYNALSAKYDVGSFEQFLKDSQDDTKRRKMYDALSADYDLGDYSIFSSKLNSPQNVVTDVESSEQPTDKITTFGEGWDQGWSGLYEGNKYTVGEIMNLGQANAKNYQDALAYLDSKGTDFDPSTFNADDEIKRNKTDRYYKRHDEWRETMKKRKAERENMGFWDKLKHISDDPDIPNIDDESVGERVAADRPVNLLADALKKSGGDITKAREILAQGAAMDETTGQRWMREASSELAKHKEAEGAAWWGQLFPQMTGQAAALGLSAFPATRPVGALLGAGSTTALTLSSMGSAMNEARQAGATDGEAWAAGGISAGIELGSEVLPFSYMFGKIGKSIARDGIQRAVSQASEAELENMFKLARDKFGGKFLSFKSAKDMGANALYEALSEAVAGGAETFIPAIYDDEGLPTFQEVLTNSVEGFKAGLAMGGFLGGGSSYLVHRGHESRRKANGGVALGEYTDKNGKTEIVEVTYSKGGQSTILHQDASVETVETSTLSKPTFFTYEEWKTNVMDVERAKINAAYNQGAQTTNAQDIRDIGDAFEADREYMVDAYGEDFVNSLDEDAVSVVHGLGDKQKDDALRYAEARARFAGYANSKKEEVSEKIKSAHELIDSHISQDDGMIRPATLTKGERKVYIMSGDVAQNDLGGIDVNASSKSIVVADAQTGELEMISPEDFLSVEGALNPQEEKDAIAQSIQNEYNDAAWGALNGYPAFGAGEIHTILGENGTPIQVSVVADNGDGTVSVTADGKNVFPYSKDAIANYEKAVRKAQYMAQRGMQSPKETAPQETTASRYNQGDVVTYTDEAGNMFTGTIVGEPTVDGVAVGTPDGVQLVNTSIINNGLVEVKDADGNVVWSKNNETGQAVAEETAQPQVAPENSVLSRIPTNEEGEHLYEQADSNDAWDALLEQTDGDVEMAQKVAQDMVAVKEAALKKAQSAKVKATTNVAVNIAAEKERKAIIAKAEQDLDAWKQIAGVQERRRLEAEEQQRLEAEAAARAEMLLAEENNLSNIPDMVDDTPQDARARGYRRVSGQKVERPSALQGYLGNKVGVKFANNAIPEGRVMVIEADNLQPSHTQGQRNPMHFLDEAQPKERKDAASLVATQRIASDIRPEEITSSVTAYTGAPTTNGRGEVIQGNSRSDALKLMWDSYPESAAKYKQYLIEHAEELGLDAEGVASMQRPVLVNMLDVTDADAITLGQYVAQDTESGGTERIKPKNVIQKMGNKMNLFAHKLLDTSDEDASFAQLVDENGTEVIKWMAQQGYITDTQYASAFDSKGNLTAEAKNDLRGMMFQSIFKGGSTQLEEMFNAMPTKAQKAILATAFRDYDSPVAERIIGNVQESIRAFYLLSQNADFASAKNYEEARNAVEAWKNQYQMDDVSGESYLPADNFSNFALELATLYKGRTQGYVQSVFNNMFDLIQGIQEADLFNENPDTTPRTLVEAIKEILNIDYNGQLRSNVLGDNHPASQRGQQGSTGNVASGEQNQDGQGTDDGGRRTEGYSGRSRNDEEREDDLQEVEEVTSAERTEMENRIVDWLSEENLSRAVGKTRDEIFNEFGNELEPVAYIPTQFMSLVSPTLKDQRIYCGKGYFIDHALRNHAKEGVQASIDDVDVSKYLNIQAVLDNPDSIKETHVDGKRTVVFIKKIGRFFAELTQVEENGKVVLHKSFFNQKKEPYAKLYDIRQEDTSSEGGTSSISHTVETAPAISLESRGDVMLNNEKFLNSDGRLIEPLEEGSDLVPTPNSISSDSKVTDNSSAEQKNAEENVSGGVNELIAQAESETDVTPTEGQKKAGNYKKGKVKVAGYEISIEQPKGSVRRGVDANGKAWEQTMHNTYGYFLGTEGVDGDHIDVFLANDMDAWNGEQVFVVDQYNEDGSFDEHKVMLGFNSIEDAQSAYLSNYEDGWADKHNIVVTGTSTSDFKKWVDSSHRKTKAFADYKTVKTTEGQSTGDKLSPIEGYTYDEVIESATNDIQNALSDADFDIEIAEVWAHGSRMRGDAKEDSDLDVVVFYKGDAKEDALFNAINELNLSFDGVRVDVNPIRVRTKADIERYKEKSAKYDAEVQSNQVENEMQGESLYSAEPAKYTTKKGKVLDMYLVKFTGELSKEQQRAAKELAKADKGWYDREQGGFMMRSEESAKRLADTILNNDDAVSDAQPVSLADTRKVVKPQQVNVENHIGELNEKVEANLSDHVEQPTNPSGNRLVTDERYAELRERMRKKLGGQMNVGIDPEVLAIGTEMAVYHLEKGARKFTEYAKAMIADLGDAIRPYLKAFYNGARNLPEVEGSEIAADMTPYDEVQQFNVATFDKEHSDPFTTAEIVVAEQAHQEEAEQAKQEIINQRNTERRNEDEQTSASTEAIASQAETVADKAESDIETATTEEQLNDVVATIDKQIEEVNKQLALLGYYEADIDDSQFHESYGYMRSAEKKAVKDADTLAKRIVKDLGIDPASIVDKKGKKRKVIAQANIAPAGGNVYIHLPLTEDRELYISVDLEPDYKGGNRDNLFIDHIMLRIENPTGQGYRYVGRNVWVQSDATYTDVLDEIRAEIIQHVPEFDLPTRKSVSEIEQKQPKAKKSKKKVVKLQQSGELGLFDSLFDNETNNEDGLQRNDATRSEGVSANGNRHEQGLSRGSETGSESEQQGSRRTDNGRETTGDAVDRTVRPRLSDTVTEPKNTRNNHSERGKDHAPTSVDARIEANIKAIELAKQLLESGEQATEKQMQTLRKFSGWGGLGKAFSEGTYYAPNLIAKRLRELLGEAAYQEAVMSANSAYYTPAYVVDTLWDIAEQMGFKGGNILEGSAGIGNILGQMPTHISERSNIHAIEIDGTSGGILSLLYPDAKVEIQGFEETRIANGSVDLAITNVPFVTGLRVNDTTGDKDLSKKFHNIHDFCIAKNVRKLREGGLGIFITSNGTLDNSKKLRDWIVNEGGADFVGAFRMHNKTFGGTGVTSDIIVIRKRVNGKKSANAIDVSTVTGERMAEYDTGETRKVKGQIVPVVKQLSMDYNQYFVEHPENMAGEMHFAFEKGDTFRPTSKGLYPKQDKKQEQMLADFVQSFTAEEFGRRNEEDEINSFSQAMQGKKLGEMFVNDGELYTYTMQGAQPISANSNKVKGHTKVECFEAYSAIKEALAAVLEYQITHEDDKGLKPLLAKLNKAYDDFVATYGHFNKNTAIAFLRNDVDYANVFALEKFEESADAKGNKVQKFGKTDVFSKRVIEKEAEPMPTNVKDGIVASIFKFGRVDIPYIAEQLGKSEAEVKAEIIESGYCFEDPATRQVEVSYQYLSGNVREKLRQAQENNENGEFDRNIKALQEVMPMTIPAHLIDFTLGSSWIEPKLYEEYVKERTDVGVQFTAVGGTWFMNEPYYTAYEKNRAMGVTSEMLGRTVMGHTLIEAAIQNKSITVSTVKKNLDGSTETITDKEATQACSAKIDEIRQDFKEWARQKMQSDAEMSERMERVYNDTFNNYVPMSIPDEFVPEYFGGASHKFKMRSHQGRAIVRGTMQPLLLAHEVGTGKTFTLISTAMEMRRLGTARKPMIVVQNATVGQFVASAKELYPNAKILTLEEADRSADGRKNFYAKIKYNDWDMIVVPQSTFEFIPDSEERQMAFVQEKIEEKMLVLEQMKEADPDGKSMITRQAEREIALLEEELAGLSGETGKKRTANDEKKRAVALQNAEVKAMEMLDRRTDDVENFDDMGIDALLIDEAHEYKHLGFATAMQRGVKGVDPSYSKKSQGVFLKTQAVLEKNNGRNVIFATGTPISNTAAEIWTFMRYLMPADTMKEYGIYYFDDFVRNFGNIQQMLEFTTSGKFKENNRFAGYVNLPELVRIWSGVSDTVLTKEAGGVSDKIPDMEGGKAQDLYLPQTRALRSIMKYVKAELERYDKMSGKEKKENSHIPLTMYGIAKAAAVDARLVQSDAEDDAQSKTNEAVRQTLRSLKESADYKGTVAIFADNYQNKESGFNLYEDIRTKLIAEGVPADEIVVIKSGMTVKKKLEIFEKVNRGEVRVILGSTFTLGTGVNIQERLYTLIHLDAPNRPMDYTQRNGRILRQGNLHKAMGKPVRVLRFGVEDSLDVTAYQRLKTKGAIADSIMNGKQMMANSMTNRVLEEEEDVFGDTVAQLSGSEYAMLKNNAEKNVRKYASRKKQWEADQTYIHNAKPRVKAFIKDAEKRIEDNSRYLEAVRASFPDGKFKEIVIGKHRFATIEAMEDFFKEHNKSLLAEMKKMKDGDIAGEQKRQLTIQIGDFSFVVTTKLTRQTVRDGATLFNDVERKMAYSCAELGIEDIPVRQNLLRNAIEDITNNVITGRDFAERVENAERVKKHNETELEQLLSREGKPFEYEAELEQAQTQYEEFSELMKKELAEKEAKYAEMDATVEAANDLATAEEADELEREGDGAYTDDEVSFESDPISKVLGKPRYTEKQRREFAERARKRMVNRVETLAKQLHLDNVEIVTDASTLEGKKQRAKGFFSKSTGKITIVIPNHAGTADVEQTVLHEAIAHYGLRKLFGEHFDTFLDNVFNHASTPIRKKIIELAQKNGWDFRTATEEYLATLAEDAYFESANNPSSGWWSKIKSFFMDMLAKAGVQLDYKLTDNELRYILWRSYQNLANPGRYNSVVEQAIDIAKQYELKVGNYREGVTDADALVSVAEKQNDELFRTGTTRERAEARERYERRVKSGLYQSQEALQDSMLGLKVAMQEIVGEDVKIEDIAGFENAYLGENRLSSVNKAEVEMFVNQYFKPLYDVVKVLAPTEEERKALEHYMIAKHGLERNAYMRNQDIENGVKGAEFKDYAGLTALTGLKDVAEAEIEAQRMVEAFENSHRRYLDDFWSRWRAITDANLLKTYQSGIIDKATLDKISSMYEYYVPLRGFDETTSVDVYAYLGKSDNAFNPAIKKAEGRKSVADNPFAYLESMVESTIMQGNRNVLVKQRMLNFVQNHPSDLFSVSDLWLEYNDRTGEWETAFPDISEYDSPEKVRQRFEDFEARMEKLAASRPDNFKKSSDAKGIPFRVVTKQHLNEHQVIVKRNGKNYVITVNGSPRAAQALNGLTNPDNTGTGAFDSFLRAGETINRHLSSFYTTRNPDFVVSNFMRDMLYTNTMVWVKESPNYALKFHKNVAICNPKKMLELYRKYRNGELNMSDELESGFYQFMMNGGETGYTNVKDIEKRKKEIAKKLRSKGIVGSETYETISVFLDEVNRSVENCARFATYMTSRQMGRSLDRSIYDAKEISVNFNKKGAGDKFLNAQGQTALGNAISMVSSVGRSGYVFWNAAIQGSTNFGRQVKRNPKKAIGAAAVMFMLGSLMAYFGDDDEEDKNAYYNIPEYVRRSNILIRLGDEYLSLPLPIEYRAFYGMGELMVSVMSGKEHLSDVELAEAIASQVSQVLPLDVLEGGGVVSALTPSVFKPIVEAYALNKSWTGLPIYKDTPFNENDPEWTKAYSNVNPIYLEGAKLLNEWTGGDAHKSGVIDFNPARFEYVFEGYLGGFASVFDKLVKMGQTVAGKREYDPRSFLLWNRLVKSGDERTELRAINNQYWKIKEEAERTEELWRDYIRDTKLGVFDYAEKIHFLEQSPEFRRFTIYEGYGKEISKLERELKLAKELGNEELVAEYNEVINAYKKEVVELINATYE